MTDKPGFKAIEKRIEELLEKTGVISPARMLMLLRRADSSPSLDVEKEMGGLQELSDDKKTE